MLGVVGRADKLKYDFEAARKRIEELKLIYRQNKHLHQEDGSWDWWIVAQIEEIEREIAEAHASRDIKMTAVSGSGHQVMHITNLVAPIVPQWAGEHKEDLQI